MEPEGNESTCRKTSTVSFPTTSIFLRLLYTRTQVQMQCTIKLHSLVSVPASFGGIPMSATSSAPIPPLSVFHCLFAPPQQLLGPHERGRGCTRRRADGWKERERHHMYPSKFGSRICNKCVRARGGGGSAQLCNSSITSNSLVCNMYRGFRARP